MIAALATTLFFAATPVFAHRAARLLGSTRANFWRLVVAVGVLGGWAHVAGAGLRGHALGWFVWGGVIGFGVGGLAMFEALPRLGSNISNLIVQCGSAISAALVEWLWLGHSLTTAQIVFASMTLVGIAIGLLPQSLPRVTPAQWGIGLAWAFVSAIAQGVGAVFSRKAFGLAASWHELIDPGTAAYQRALGGLIVAAIALAFITVRRLEPASSAKAAPPWVLANAATGPILGVTCYQWALRTTPAGIVQPIVAAAPLFTIPLAAWLEQGRVRKPYYAGVILAVIGVTGLLLAK